MRTRTQNSQDGRPVRHGIATVIFWLLPLLAFAGVVAPNFVQIAEEEEEIASSGTLIFRPVRLGRPPLVVSRDYSAGFVPELIDLEALFNGDSFRAERGMQLKDLPSFPSSRGDTIVIDDVDIAAADDFFKDLLRPTFVANTREIWDPDIFDIIPPLFGIGNDVRFDDFPNPGMDTDNAVVPEPQTAVLTSLGLVYLAYAGRKRSRGARSEA
jgi:hypothetical protein